MEEARAVIYSKRGAMPTSTDYPEFYSIAVRPIVQSLCLRSHIHFVSVPSIRRIRKVVRHIPLMKLKFQNTCFKSGSHIVSSITTQTYAQRVHLIKSSFALPDYLKMVPYNTLHAI